jgi:hypothetical protein
MKHGYARRGQKTRTYRIWQQLAHRTRYSTGPVCAEWRGSFATFLHEMGECPSPHHTIDRIDNSRGYEPDNCRWATMKEQQNNRTNNRCITLGETTQTLQQWSDQTGIKRETIARRIDKLGWPLEDALTRTASYSARRYSPPKNAEMFTAFNQTHSLGVWAKMYGVSYQTLRQRVRRYGWSLERALTTPVS